MTEQTKGKGRIPFENLEQSEAVESWQLPSMQSGGKVVRSAKRDGNGKKDSNVAIEKVSSSKRPRHLTADELQQITEEARQEGFKQGLKEGTEQGIREGTKAGEKAGNQRAYMDAKKDIEALQNQLRQIITRLHEPMLKQDLQLENIMVDAVLRLSKALLLEEISAKPTRLLNVIQHVLTSLPKGANNIRILLNSADAALIESLVPESQRDWAVQVNDSLASGGCNVETESSLIDFSVENRIESYLSSIGGLNGGDIEDMSTVPEYHDVITDSTKSREKPPEKVEALSERTPADDENLDSDIDEDGLASDER